MNKNIPEEAKENYLLIDGRMVTSEQTIPVINPCNEQEITRVPTATGEHLEAAIFAAQTAFSNWAQDEAVRQNLLRKIAGVIAENIDTLATLLSLETGLPLGNARDEVAMAGYFFKYRSASSPATETIHDDEKQRVQVIRKPIGVVGAIIPWNAPMMIASEKLSTALAAGNTVVMKTSPMAPLALLHFAKLLAEVLPAGVINVLCGDDEIGKRMVSDPRVGMISFTGSTSAGKAIMASGGASLKRLSLELGGNDAAIVMPDADVKKVASKIFWGAFYRTGQVCAAIKRLYVPAALKEEMLEALAQVCQKIVPGDSFAEGALLGPLANRQQYEKVTSLVERSVAEGGVIAAGGEATAEPGFFYPPTLIAEVNASNPLVVEEQFGPVLPVIVYDDLADAIKQANATEYGLGASVWGTDLDAAEKVALQLEAGSVWINRHGIVMPDIPFGGFKHSGLGRANGAVGLDSYCELQTVSIAKPRK